MPLAIILAVFLALFTLGTKMHLGASHPAQVVILGGEKYNWMDKNTNSDTAILKAPEQTDHKIFINGRHDASFFENIFQQVFMYRIDESDLSDATNYITRNSNGEQLIRP